MPIPEVEVGQIRAQNGAPRPSFGIFPASITASSVARSGKRKAVGWKATCPGRARRSPGSWRDPVRYLPAAIPARTAGAHRAAPAGESGRLARNGRICQPFRQLMCFAPGRLWFDLAERFLRRGEQPVQRACNVVAVRRDRSSFCRSSPRGIDVISSSASRNSPPSCSTIGSSRPTASGMDARGASGATIRPRPSPARSACSTVRNGNARRVLGAGLANTSCCIG